MNASRLQVCVREGNLIGVGNKDVYGRKYIAFRGIPYAKPPLGELRFKDPVPIEPWIGDREASKYGNPCLQKEIMTQELIGDEDCLYLNVFTTDIKPQKKRAVMVWIHGGGFFTGTGDDSLYGPDYIVQKEVVLVTLNYRLGALGFLNLDDEVATGNQGLKDVILALRWVQKNIAAFGGDAENVTMFGESAGAVIVHLLSLSPLTVGLFHKMILQSGSALNHWSFNEWSRNKETNNGFYWAEKFGMKTMDPKVAYEFLKTVDAKKFVQIKKDRLFDLQVNLWFTPILDDKSSCPVLPEHPRKLMQRARKMPMLLGCTSCEGSFFLKGRFYGDVSDDLLRQIDADFSMAFPPKILSRLPSIPITPKELKYFYFGNKPLNENISCYMNFLGDVSFYQSATEVASLRQNTDSTYMYCFSYDSKTCFTKQLFDIHISGCTHTEDLSYLFYPYAMPIPTPIAPDSNDYKMIESMVQMWTDYAKTGNPTPAINQLTPVKWTPVKPNSDVLDYLDINLKPEMKAYRKGKERWDWENIRRKH